MSHPPCSIVTDSEATASYDPYMPWELKRYYGAGHLHFITCSCYHRKPWLGTPARRDLFLQVLERMRQRYSFVVCAYVAMPEHFHLLISEPQEVTPSVVLQALKLGFVRCLAPENGPKKAPLLAQDARNGAPTLSSTPGIPRHIWQRRFYDFNVWTERKRVEKLRYIHRNPVKRGLVSEPGEWAWSSFRAYMYGEVGPVRVNDWSVLKMKVRVK